MLSIKILIVEDDNYINNLIYDTLMQKKFECVRAFSGTEAMLYIENYEISLIILDLMLPGMTGEELLAKIKPQNKTPVIILSAKDELDSKVELLTLGADDYITKPFQIKELVARVEVQLRKSNNTTIEKRLSYKGVTLDFDSYKGIIDNQAISLTPQEFKILELLMSNPQKVYSKSDIYNYAWEDYYIGEDKTINVHISNIRQKLKAAGKEDFIETVWGIGFKLAD